MATYRMVYGDDEQVVRETYRDITEVEREERLGSCSSGVRRRSCACRRPT